MKSTPVQPDHYNNGGADVIHLLYQVLPFEQFKGFMKGNIVKYAVRYDRKNGIEDLNKLAEYKRRLEEYEILETKK